MSTNIADLKCLAKTRPAQGNFETTGPPLETVVTVIIEEKTKPVRSETMMMSRKCSCG